MLWALDGIDILKKNNTSSVSNEIIKMIVEKSENRFLKNVLITSRTGVKDLLLNCFFLEVEGFGEKEKEKYIENHLYDCSQRQPTKYKMK